MNLLKKVSNCHSVWENTIKIVICEKITELLQSLLAIALILCPFSLGSPSASCCHSLKFWRYFLLLPTFLLLSTTVQHTHCSFCDFLLLESSTSSMMDELFKYPLTINGSFTFWVTSSWQLPCHSITSHICFIRAVTLCHLLYRTLSHKSLYFGVNHI